MKNVNVKTGTVIAAFIFSIITALFILVFGIGPSTQPGDSGVVTDAERELEVGCLDCTYDVAYGWPLVAFERSAGGFSGGIEGKFNIPNTTIDFLIYFTFYALILTTFDLAKLAVKKKK